MRDKKDLKPIEFKFLKAYIENGGNATKAAAFVKGYNLSDPKDIAKATNLGSKWYRKLKLTISEELEAQGLTKSKLAVVASEGIKADKIQVDKYGSEHINPDHKVRHLYFDSVCKLKGLYPNQKIDLDVKSTGVIVVPDIMKNEDLWLTQLDKIKQLFEDVEGK